MKLVPIAAAALIAASVAAPAAAQDWQAAMDYQIATAQGLVLDSMNRSVAEQQSARQNAKRSARMTPDERARNCATVRANLNKLTASQMRIYRRACT